MGLELYNLAKYNQFVFILSLILVSVECVDGFSVPGDLDDNMIISVRELDAAENDFNDGDINSSTLDTIKHIHKNYPRNITDSSGRHVTIYAPVNRIVPIGYSITEILKSIDAQDKVVAVDEYAKKRTGLFPKLSQLPSIGNTMSPDIETVLALDPDLVVMWKGDAFGTKYEEMQKTLEKANPNLTIVRLDFFNIGQFADEVEKLGYILEKEKESQKLLDFYRRCLGPLENTVVGLSDGEKPRVYMERSIGDFMACASGSSWHDKLLRAGGKNIVDDSAGSYPEISPELVLSEDPQVAIKLFTSSNPYGEKDETAEMQTVMEKIVNRRGWNATSAAKENRIYVLSDEILSGSRFFIGIPYLAKILHPNLFAELDPKSLHQEYLNEFMDSDYDLEVHGDFIYPKIADESL